MAMEGEKGKPALEWRGTSHDDYLAFDQEAKKRSIAFIRQPECVRGNETNFSKR